MTTHYDSNGDQISNDDRIFLHKDTTMTSTEITETVNLRYDRCDRVAIGGVQIACGYLWRVYPTGDDAPEIERDGEPQQIGFHGNDTPPCAAEWVADDAPAYYVMTRSADLPVVVEGWAIETAEADEADSFANDVGRTTIIKLKFDRDRVRTIAVVALDY